MYDSGVVPTVLVACHRARLPISSQFEISNYVDISRLFSEKNNIAELNRLTVKDNYRRGDAVRKLLAFELLFLSQLGISGYLGSASSVPLLRLFSKAGFNKVDIDEFKFDSDDENYSARSFP